MTYNEFIQQILDTRGRFGIPEGEYKERHHIIPECKGGQTIEENLIDLYAQEHYDAHKLLFEENPNDYQLACAWHNFHTRKASLNAPEIEIDREEYARLKKELSKLRSEAYSGEGNPRYGDHRNFVSEKQAEIWRQNWLGDKNPNYGKNTHSWGAGMKKGYKHTNETKANMSKAGKGKSKSLEHRKHISENSGTRGKNTHLWGAGRKKGYKESDEIKLKRSIIVSGSNNPRAKAVKCIETGEIFGCTKFACEKYHTSKGSIKNSCLDNSKTAAGYHWEYVDKK